ncbi:2-hydroxyacid dehydrogenase [Halovulum dunhuangense]|uniref:2-hydroxyacid dehydrogenase n=1 Tax=Halovulum dunhuangense TaxID=1505036 RepID=A0A849L493_9RHOB|nr:2-hydroxyacid dehydrogenase [Halovulum dunhuangense]NNU81165.1 2-hydroxyacid dehydrogenase [Halovulum dunhuangense]
MTKPDLLMVGPYSEADTEALAALCTIHKGTPADGVAASIRAVAYRSMKPFGAAEMDALPALELIALFGVGHDHVDLEAARARGIAVANTPDVLNDDVADLAVGMLLASARRIPQADEWVRGGDWARQGAFPLLRKVSGKPAGILGLGRIGRAIANRLSAFDMPIHYWSRTPKKTPAGWQRHDSALSLAREVDFLVLAVAGGPDTAGMVSAEVLDALGPEGTLVNIARGSVVDEEALIAALADRRIAAAALDVFASEPAPDPRLAALPNVLMQPHHASGTVETRAAMGALQRENIRAFFEGRPLPGRVV